jgi:hypothetical protein
VGENIDELAQRITEYAATIHEANTRTLDPIIIELARDRGLTSSASLDRRWTNWGS